MENYNLTSSGTIKSNSGQEPKLEDKTPRERKRP
ncbi:unnamed protein product, partial [Larinioides sclopetarius]